MASKDTADQPTVARDDRAPAEDLNALNERIAKAGAEATTAEARGKAAGA